MNRHSGLRARLHRLEKRLQQRKPLPTIIIGIYPEEQPGPIVGIEGAGVFCRLKAGETEPELQRRAVASIPSRFLAMRYGPARAAPQRDCDASPCPTPAAAPEGAPAAASGIPGIGAVATREQLFRMGVIRVPPERLI